MPNICTNPGVGCLKTILSPPAVPIHNLLRFLRNGRNYYLLMFAINSLLFINFFMPNMYINPGVGCLKAIVSSPAVPIRNLLRFLRGARRKKRLFVINACNTLLCLTFFYAGYVYQPGTVKKEWRTTNLMTH